MQALQQRNQPLQLRRATLLRQAHEAVQRIQKQAAITLTTQACGALKQVLLPLGAGQVCYIALPLVITLAARQLRSIGRDFILGRQFTNGQIGKGDGALGLQKGNLVGLNMPRFEHNPVVLGQLGQRRLGGIPEGYRRGPGRSLGRCHAEQTREGEHQRTGQRSQTQNSTRQQHQIVS